MLKLPLAAHSDSDFYWVHKPGLQCTAELLPASALVLPGQDKSWLSRQESVMALKFAFDSTVFRPIK